jgi:hypothetical protein
MSDQPQKLLLTCFGLGSAVGDITTLTAVPRDLHRLYPGDFEIHVATSHPELWRHNSNVVLREDIGPSVTSIPGYRTVSCHYPGINTSNRLPKHCLTSWFDYLSAALNLPMQPLEFKGDLHLSEEERDTYPVLDLDGEPVRYWLLNAGGKADFSAKWIPTPHWQSVVWRMRDAFGNKVRVVQIGCPGHYHPILHDAINNVGQTTLRQAIQLIYHSEGVIGPVSFQNHAAAAVPIKRPAFPLPPRVLKEKTENLLYGPPLRPNVVVAGGREPSQWEQYPGSQYLSNVGTMDCCAHGGCFRSRCMEICDGDDSDISNRCLHPVTMANVAYPECLVAIKPEQIFAAIWSYYRGGVLSIPK